MLIIRHLKRTKITVENITPTSVFSHAGLYADDCDGIFCAIDAENRKKVDIEFFFDTDYISSAHNKYVLNLTTNAGYSKRHVASAECGRLVFHLDEDDLQKKELLAELLSFFGTPIAKVRLRLNELDEYGKIYETSGLKDDADFDEALEAFINNER